MGYKLVMGQVEDRMYLVKSGDTYYFINLDINVKPMHSKYIETFLRFAPYLEEMETTNKEDEALIKERMDKYFK